MAVTTVDYLIIGAGLAGMTLRRALGVPRVALLDPHPFRYKLGESIVPEHFTHPLCHDIRDEVPLLPSFSPKRGSMYIGPDSVAAFPLPPTTYASAAHLRREDLEEKMAQMWGLEIERERVEHYDPESNVVRTDKRTWKVTRQVIDCSGVARVLARSMRIEREVWPSFTSWMYLDVREVTDERFSEFLKETKRAYARLDPGVGRVLSKEEYPGWAPSNCTIVWKLRDGMFSWQIPLYQKSVLSFGVTSRHGPIAREELLSIAKDFVAPCYRTDPRPFDGSSDYNRFHVYNRFSREAERATSGKWILIGDAAFFGEPIYATGTAVTVNQALFVAAALNTVGWSAEVQSEYSQRCGRVRESAFAARSYFFKPEENTPESTREFKDRGLEGTAFQLTMANNYGKILSGVRVFEEGDTRFGSRFGVTAEKQRVTTERVATLSQNVLTERVSLRMAWPSDGAVQCAFAIEGKPDLVVRLERQRFGVRYFCTGGAMGVMYLNLPEGEYALEEKSLGVLEGLRESLEENEKEWILLMDETVG